MMTRVSRCVSGYTHARGKKRAKEIGVVTRVKKPENGSEVKGKGWKRGKGSLAVHLGFIEYNARV